MSSDAAPDYQASADDYLQRADLMAELGRYDDAVTELGFAITLDQASVRAWTMLARTHLAAERPEEALAAADTATAVSTATAAVPGAAPDWAPPLVARGIALVELRRFREAAEVADEILGRGPADAYAQRSAAGILADARNGQPALNAAWRAVELAPQESQAHLVLGMVAARLNLFDLAERAYQEALRLDPTLDTAGDDVGQSRLERRRYARALEEVAATVSIQPVRVDSYRSVAESVLRLVTYGAGYSITAAVLVAFMAAASGGASRAWAALLAIVGGVLVWRFASKVPGLTRTVLPTLMSQDRVLGLSVYATLAAPAFLLLYTLVGTPWPLVLTIVATAVAELAVLRRYGPAAR
ncbi:tetratricopeptide repeat protein [Micromonospora pisi]|uniref:Tetratricopeptide repeat protein n=1 Tax=Micromonospora pisi TaxID=589240 RepID=A0A495JJ66_9ACTN|nr:tetratricopeptide repeat protein [Micromonospora pisi]RKR88957.1 tetratricopeptide repeat protein [Micromonospora pisi]